MMPAVQKSRSQRYPVDLTANITTPYGTPVRGRMRNVSTTGVLMEASEKDAPIICDSDITVRFYIPTKRGEVYRRIPLRVARFNDRHVGLEIQDYNEETVASMRDLLRHALKVN